MSILKHLKRQVALATLAFTDVSKSALANQKNLGIDGASQAMTQSVLSETKQTLNDVLNSRQSLQTNALAQAWWNKHIQWKRTAWIDGVHRELTDEEWRTRWETWADPANAKRGAVLFFHEMENYDDDSAGVEVINGRSVLNEVKKQQAQEGNYVFTAAPGFYFPLQRLVKVFVRKSTTDEYTVELHSDLYKLTQQAASTDRTKGGTVTYSWNIEETETQDVDMRDQLTYDMTLDPDYNYLLSGLQRVALAQEEYEGVVVRSFSLTGAAQVTLHKGAIVLTYGAQEAMPTAREIRQLS
jgi:hypothetical protein